MTHNGGTLLSTGVYKKKKKSVGRRAMRNTFQSGKRTLFWEIFKDFHIPE